MRCGGTSSPPASRGRRAACPTMGFVRPPARRCSRCGTCSRSSRRTQTSTGGRRATNRVEPAHLLDRWILNELDDTVTVVTTALDDFDALTGATRLATFVDDLSNWYVRRSRPRFWKSSDPGRAPDAAPVPRRDEPAARAVLPVPVRRDLHASDRRPLGAHLRLAGRTGARCGRSRSEMESVRRLVSVGRARARRREGQGASAPAASAAPPSGRDAVRRGEDRDRRRAERQGARRHREPVGPRLVDRGPELPCARAHGSARR